MKPKNKWVLLLETRDLDNFIDRMVIEQYGIRNIMSFNDPITALLHLKSTKTKYDLILIHLQMLPISGLEFIRQMRELGYDKQQGQICIVSSSIDPKDEESALRQNIKFVLKPITAEVLKDLFGD